MSKKPKFSLTGVLIEDSETNEFTTYIAEMPEVIAQGKTEKEAKDNLYHALLSILEFKRSEIISEANHNSEHGVVTQFDLQLA